MDAGDVRFESGGVCQRNRFSKITRSGLNLMTLRDKPFRQCFEKWNVRGVCEIDPETHW